MSEDNALVNEILRGNNRGLQVLAAKGLVPLPPGDLVGVQVRLAAGPDQEIAAAAAEAIRETEARVVADLVASTSDLEILEYLGRHSGDSRILQAVIQRRDVSDRLLAELARTVEEDLQEILVLRQDAIIEHPEILDALEENPNLGSLVRRKIREYRDHLLRKDRGRRTTREALEAEADDLSTEEVENALAEAREVQAEGDRDEDLTGLAESQLRVLPIPVRMKLARGAPRALRNILIRDPNPMVATSVLDHNALGESEIEQIARSRAVSADVLEVIANHRMWTRKYTIVVALVRNPRVPVGIALRYLPRLAVRDLHSLTRDRNVAEAVRTSAKRLYTMKSR